MLDDSNPRDLAKFFGLLQNRDMFRLPYLHRFENGYGKQHRIVLKQNFLSTQKQCIRALQCEPLAHLLCCVFFKGQFGVFVLKAQGVDLRKNV